MQVCQFYVDDILYGVDVTEVLEIIRFQNATFVPLAEPCISGLINLRGQIITAINLRIRLGMQVTYCDVLPMCIVVHDIEGPPVSLIVDKIGDVINIHRRDIEESPETVPKAYRNLIDGIVKLDNNLLLMLNLKKTLQLH